MKKHLISLISLGLLILAKSSLANGNVSFGKVDQVVAPHLQIIINNHLAEQVNVEFKSHSYNTIWNGQCRDSVYSTQNKMICKESAVLSNGIPALFPLVYVSPNNQGPDPHAFYLSDYEHRINWQVQPFDGDIFIKNLSGETLAKISYAMKIYPATLGTKIKHYLSYDGGAYAMWDDFKKDPAIDDHSKATITLSDSYPSGSPWCYESENEYYGSFGDSEYYYQYNVADRLNKDPARMPCSAVLMIDLSEKI